MNRVVQIGTFQVAGVMGPVLKRTMTLTLQNGNATFSNSDVLAAMQIINVHPSSLICKLNQCVLHTYDPILQVHIDLLKTVLPAGAIISVPEFFAGVSGVFTADHEIDNVTLQWAFGQVNIGLNSLSCVMDSVFTCSFDTYQDIGPDVISALNSSLRLLTFSVDLETSSPAPELPSGLRGTMTMPYSTNMYLVLSNANVSNYTDLQCFASLTNDNAMVCSYFVTDPLSEEQIFQIVNATGVLAATAPVAVTMNSAMRDSLISSISILLQIPSSRILVVALDAASGTATVNLLPSSALTPAQQLGTMWSVSFDVCGLTSISVTNATAVAASCGMPADYVVVTGGTHVSLRTSNASNATMQCLNNHPLVCQSSVTPPSWADASLSHKELGDALAWDSDNNLVTFTIGGRVFWALPSLASLFTATTTSTPSAAASSSGGSAAFAAAGAGAGALAVIAVVALVVIRRRRRSTQPKPATAAATSKSDGTTVSGAYGRTASFSSNRTSSMRGIRNEMYGASSAPGVVNPIFMEHDENGYLDCSPQEAPVDDTLYSDLGKTPYVFSNPLYGAGQPAVKNAPPHPAMEDEPEGGYDEIRPATSYEYQTYGEGGYGGLSQHVIKHDQNASGYLDMGPVEAPSTTNTNNNNTTANNSIYADYDNSPYQEPVYGFGAEYQGVDENYLPAE